MRPIRIALCQITPGRDCGRTVERAFAMIGEAAAAGANLVALPEIFYAPYNLLLIKRLGDMTRLVPEFALAAKRHRVFVCTGSLATGSPEGGLLNTSFLIGPDGETLLSYSKCHLFSVSLKGLRADESAVFSPGSSVAPVATPIANIGMLVCYDIRFPEMARSLALQGAELILVPAAFNTITGPAHWHVTLRARAVENQLYVAAVSQGRSPGEKYEAYGHSLLVSPWGDVLAEAGEGDEIVYADLDPAVLEQTRERMPLLKQRRPDLYGGDRTKRNGGTTPFSL